MSMVTEAYIQVSLGIARDQYDLVVALLSEAGYYAFEETPAELRAFISERDYDAARLEAILGEYFAGQAVAPVVEVIPAKDWNAEWEANFHSVQVGDFCEVYPPHRAPDPGIRHHVMVAPKMAFGTGHHATTWLMMDQCSRFDFAGRDVLDMGCGTGVLGILTRLLGAARTTCIDIDPWSEENCHENAALNGVSGLEVILGDASAIPPHCYDFVLANINRNVLMADRDHYWASLKPGGKIAISGFYDFDEAGVAAHFAAAGFAPIARATRDNWVMLAFEKPTPSA